MIRLALLTLLLAAPAAAQDDREVFRLGDDLYLAGASVELTTDGIDDVFAAGERVDLSAAISGTAHLAGRRVNSEAAIGGDLYAAGADVTVTAPVAGSATLFGYDVTVGAAVGAALRASGAHVQVEAPVAGTALLTGGSVTLDDVVTGDAAIAASTLDFGPDARIDGRLVLFGDGRRELVVPDRVIPADRIERRALPDDVEGFGGGRPSAIALAGGFLIGVLFIAVLATLIALIAPRSMERLRDIVGDGPLRSVWIGFLTLSALVGSSIVLILTLVGIFAAPVILFVAVLLGFLGYVIAVYLVGRAIWGRFGGLAPDTFAEQVIIALVGAVVVGVLALIPFLGWIVLLILTLTGLGALTIAVFRPELRTV